MTCAGTNGTSLAQLQAPRRNRYFYGKLLDVLHLKMEQQYGIAASAHVNRLNFGSGVFCGLEVTPINQGDRHGVRLESGAALDGLGRRIIVPDAVELAPLALTDDRGVRVQPQPDPLPPSLVLSVCYRECEADFTPALVPDPACNGSTRCEAGTWVESYSLVLRAADARDPVTHACRDDVIARLKAGDVQGALCALAAECPEVPPDVCVALAVIDVAADGPVSVADPCPVRPIVPTNLALLELISCLAQRVEECCSNGGPGPAARTFRIAEVALGSTAKPDESLLSTSPGGLTISARLKPTTISISFTGGKIDENSIVLGTNVVVKDANGVEPAFRTPMFVGGRVIRLQLVRGQLARGKYTLTISGDPPTPVKSTTGSALDAEPTQLPTGNKTPGGVFTATFEVVQ
jgi:hypothetical protein